MKEFVAITDDLFYNHPELYDRLVPFSHDVACRHLIPQPLTMDGYGDVIEFTILDSSGNELGSQQELRACAAH
ncbi:hypothetical protein QP938_08235 [Porticoccaceae bacterium LTM1]|nr:hypothetical protein QP938_08235 [Porticoccaceae bacterium LTM1]